VETEIQSRSTQSGAPESIPAGRLAMTVEETAARLGISRPSAYQGVRLGQIPSIRIGRRLLVPVAALERMFTGESK
jgi:excisionase family DNA binding protein